MPPWKSGIWPLIAEVMKSSSQKSAAAFIQVFAETLEVAEGLEVSREQRVGNLDKYLKTQHTRVF